MQQRLTPLARAVTTGFGIAGLKAAMDLAGSRRGRSASAARAACRRRHRKDSDTAAMTPPTEPPPQLRGKLLLGPGPSPVSPRVMRAMAAPVLSHLDPEMMAILDDVRARLGCGVQAPATDAFAFAVSGHRHVRHGSGRRQPDAARHARRGGRHRLLRRSAGADAAALRRDGDARRRSSGAAPAIRRGSSRALARRRRPGDDGPRRNVDGRAQSGRGDVRARARRAARMTIVDAVTSLGAHPVDAAAWGADVGLQLHAEGARRAVGAGADHVLARARDVQPKIATSRSRSTSISSCSKTTGSTASTTTRFPRRSSTRCRKRSRSSKRKGSRRAGRGIAPTTRRWSTGSAAIGSAAAAAAGASGSGR